MKLKPGSPLAMFVRSFLPSFSRSTVSDQIDMLRDELKSKTLPPYVSAVDTTVGFRGKNALKHPWSANVTAQFMKSKYKFNNREFTYKPQNHVEMVEQVLQHLDGKLKYLDELIEKSFSDEIVNAQLSYLQTNLIRLAELTEFYLIYARKLLILTVQREFEKLDARIASTHSPMVKADIAWLDNNLHAFISITTIYSQNKEDFIRAIKSIPDLTVIDDEGQADVAGSVYGHKLDPLEMNFIPYYFNPIYHVRNLVVQWRHNRIESAKAEREYLELRLQQYRLKLGGTDNAKMEQIIATTEERMKKLNKKISDMEASYAEDYGL